MGRWPYSDRKTVEQCKRLSLYRSDLGKQLRENAPMGYRGGNLEISYTIGTETLKYRIQLEVTACPKGGFRHWLICPLVKDGKPCRRRVGVLYLPPGQKYYGCRQCYNLTYKCQKEHNKRLDLYRKNPELLLNLVGSHKASDLLLAIDLYTENLNKLMKKVTL